MDTSAVLVGPNASGKSNFLDALQLLSRIATCPTLKKAFAPPHRGFPLESFTFGESGIEGLREQENVSFCMEADIQLSPTVVENVNSQIQKMMPTGVNNTYQNASKRLPLVREENLRYRIEIEMLPKLGVLRVADEYLAALSAKGTVKQNRKPFLQRVDDELHLRLEGETHSACYKQPLDQSILSMRHSPLHYPHVVAMQHEFANYFTHYFEPRERMRIPTPAAEVHHIGLMGEDIAGYLNTLKGYNERQFESLEKALQRIVPAVTGIDVCVNKIGEVELYLLEGQKRISARLLSEGTLRILGLLALVGSEKPPTLIGFEEPENGVHPRQIRRIAGFLEARRLLERTQYIVTTHSSLLPDRVPPKCLYVCRKVDGKTEIEPFTRMSSAPLWKKLDADVVLKDKHALSPSERILRGDFDA